MIGLTTATNSIAHFAYAKSALRQIAYEAASQYGEPDVSIEDVQDEVKLQISSRLGDFDYQLDFAENQNMVSCQLELEPKALSELLSVASPSIRVSASAITKSFI
jgi:hypothetical protein